MTAAALGAVVALLAGPPVLRREAPSLAESVVAVALLVVALGRLLWIRRSGAGGRVQQGPAELTGDDASRLDAAPPTAPEDSRTVATASPEGVSGTTPVEAEPDVATVPRAHVATVAHEVRTPLTSVVGHLDLLAGASRLSPEDRRTVEQAIAGVQRAAALIGDLTAAPGTGSAQPVHAVRLDLDHLVRIALEDFGPLAGRRAISIAYDSPGPTWVHGDERRLRQVVDNLLSNAVKYNEDQGWIDVRLAPEEHAERRDGAPEARVVLEMTNPGATLTPEEAGRAFEDEFRAASAPGLADGSGIGLGVVRRHVESHAGAVRLESSPQTLTTTVRVTLPTDEPADEPAGELPDELTDGPTDGHVHEQTGRKHPEAGAVPDA